LQIRKNRTTILILAYLLVGVYFFLLGESGILERMKLFRNKEKLDSSISALARENQNLQKEYSIISNDNTNKSYYKEEASKSGYIAGKEKYIFFKANKSKESAGNIAPKEDKYAVQISHLRIIWIVSSIIVLSLYLWKKNSERKKEGENLNL
jgi:hypothetical protein